MVRLPDETDEAFAYRKSVQMLDEVQQRGVMLKALQESHDVLACRVDMMAIELTQNTAATKRVEANTAEIVEIFGAMKGGFKVLGWIGAAGQKLLWIGVPFAAVGVFWHNLQPHLPSWLGGTK